MISETYRENPLVLGGFPTFAEPETTAADQVGPVFKTGLFNPDAMSFGAGHTVETVRADLVGTPLFLRRPLADG